MPRGKSSRLVLSVSLLGLIVAAALIGRSLLRREAELGTRDGDTLPMLAQPVADTLASMIERLDAMSADFEDRRDVKCWTSFKQLETFVAGCQLSPPTTHLKTAVVLGYLDQIWDAAARAAGGKGAIDLAVFEETARKVFPYEKLDLLTYTVRLDDRSVVIPFQDVENYLGTVEPIRLLQTVARQSAERTPERAGLAVEALGSAVQLAALLSTMTLKEANTVARANQHALIEDADLLEADRRIAGAVGLRPMDPRLPKSETDAAEEEQDSHAAPLEVVRAKIHSLNTFNTTYSRERLDEVFDENLSRHEEEWAGMPVDPEFSRRYREDGLVSRARFLYVEAARQHPASDPLTGPEVLETILSYYPFVTMYQGATKILFPEYEQIQNLWVEEYQADTFRDTAWHWRALERALLDAARKGEQLPAMDLYALEELSEFLSIYGVAVVRGAGQMARQAGKQRVTLKELEVVNGLFEGGTREHRKRLEDVEATVEAAAEPAAISRPEDAAASRSEVRRRLDEAYIGEIFSDTTPGSGIDFEHRTSRLVTEYRFAPERRTKEQEEFPFPVPNLEIGIAGGGVAVGDIDGDALLDIYLVSGEEDRLYRNLGGLRFEDVTKASNLKDGGEGRGAYFIDYDNDGDQDLFVTHVYAPNRLFRNTGEGVFEDVTAEVGLPLRRDLISHSAVWFDLENDGRLDLYVGNFADWLGGELPLVAHNSRNGQANQLFRQNRDGRFEDITEPSGAGDIGWTHAVSHFDANGDGWQDLYLANDFGEDRLFLSSKGQRFVDATPPILENRYLHGMSVGFSDVNRDGIEDVYVSNIAMFTFVSKYIKPGAETPVAVSQRTSQNTRMMENNLLLVSAAGTFTESHHGYFDRSPQGCGWAWDADFFDFDNDGEEDIYIVNGREPNLSYDRERNVLYKQWDGHFYDVSAGSGADFKANSRGAAFADFDGDGDLDVICNNYQDKAVLLRNNLQRNNWVRFWLRGTISSRDAVGARVTLTTKDGRQIRTVRGGSGFLSKEPNRLHFGLGEAVEIERVDVHWPSGRRQSLTDLAINTEHRITEPVR